MELELQKLKSALKDLEQQRDIFVQQSHRFDEYIERIDEEIRQVKRKIYYIELEDR